MSTPRLNKGLRAVAFAAVLLGAGAAAGVWWARHEAAPGHAAPEAPAQAPSGTTAAGGERRVLYWYDPMVPSQRFDKPGKSPFMDMDLVPKYADEGADSASVRIEPGVAQNLGMRLATVTRGTHETQVEASGVIGFNDRDVAIVQTRAGGFVERVAPLAPGDIVKAGAVIAELLVPEWAAAQQEFLALAASGDAALREAGRERMRLAGMPDALIRQVEGSGRVQPRVAITAPRAGMLQELGVRSGMTLAPGQTVATINGLATVWLEAAVPEAQAGSLRVGQSVEARLAALPGETLAGRVTALLPALDTAARTLRVRIELPNRGARLRPGLSAQVRLKGGAGEPALRVPTEAVIRTGKRAIVIVAEEGGRYRPQEVELGPEAGEHTVVAAGLKEGERVVASGQFLIDSEASLQGVLARSAHEAAAPALHEADATIEDISAGEVMLDHGPFPTLAMPGMTMEFPLARPEVGQGLKAGDRVRVALRETDTGLVVERLEKQGAAQ